MESMQDHISSSKREGHIEFFIEERNEDYVISRMPVSKGLLNPLGVIQAGAMIWLADVTASVLAIGGQEIGPQGKGFPLAVDLHTTLLSNQRDGEIKAEARFVRKSRRMIVIRTRITGVEGRLLAEVTSTHIPAI
ncbi:MAG TPA: PaaI family thioesterase [Thermodesulfobacteriota bacterium]|nr:PaaI family thioesterase [Thermodesulfobacteriota bacterium]